MPADALLPPEGVSRRFTPPLPASVAAWPPGGVGRRSRAGRCNNDVPRSRRRSGACELRTGTFPTPSQLRAHAFSHSSFAALSVRRQRQQVLAPPRCPSGRIIIVSSSMAKKRKHGTQTSMTTKATAGRGNFNEVSAASEARGLTDGVRLATMLDPREDRPNKKGNEDGNGDDDASVIMPVVGFGTYRLGEKQVECATLKAIETGYRCIDTAFIYGGEKTERLVGQAIGTALKIGIIKDRDEVFVTTKHWRKYHGYEESLQCLELSLKRLGVDYVDLWLMHWPGPAYSTMNRRKDVVEEDRWHYATTAEGDMAQVRSETWRAMEDAHRNGKARAIGVSNMTVQHLEALKERASIWPPAVNQVEMHPLYPQTELLEYCRREGIVVQAYSSLGGQDTGKAEWNRILGVSSQSVPSVTPDGKKEKMKKVVKHDLLHARPVANLAAEVGVTPAQILLRWALERDCAVIPKTESPERMDENADLFSFRLLKGQVDQLQESLLEMARGNNPDRKDDIESVTRLAWRRDPLRQLDFD